MASRFQGAPALAPHRFKTQLHFWFRAVSKFYTVSLPHSLSTQKHENFIVFGVNIGVSLHLFRLCNGGMGIKRPIYGLCIKLNISLRNKQRIGKRCFLYELVLVI